MRGRRVWARWLKSRYEEPLSTSWRSSSCHLFSVSGIRTRLKAQDVGCRQLSGFWTRLTAITVSRSCCMRRHPCFLSVFSIPSVPPFFWLSHSRGFHLLRKVSSHTRHSIPPTHPPYLGLFFSFLSVILPWIIIWKSTPQLSHFPGIWLGGGETLDEAGLLVPVLNHS